MLSSSLQQLSPQLEPQSSGQLQPDSVAELERWGEWYLEETGVDGEIVDIRTIAPLDVDTITASVNKTGRCVIAHEATRFSGFGAELAATLQKDCFYYLEAPIGRVAGWDTPYPHAFEWQYFPGLKRMSAGIRRVMEAE